MVKVRRWAAGQRQKAQDRDAAYQKAAKGAGTQLKAGYCLTLLSEPDGQSTAQGGQQAAKGAGGPGCSLPKKAPEDRDAAHQKLAKKFCCSWHALPCCRLGRRITYHTHHAIYIVIHPLHYPRTTHPAPHAPATPQGEGDSTMADPWRWPGGLERWRRIYLYIYI